MGVRICAEILEQIPLRAEMSVVLAGSPQAHPAFSPVASHTCGQVCMVENLG